MSTKEHIAQLMAQIMALQAQLAHRSQFPPPAPAQPRAAPPPPLKPPKVPAPSPFSGVQDDLYPFKAKCSLYLSMRRSEFPDECSNTLFVLSYMKGGWAILFTVGWLNPLSHPRTLSGRVTIAKAASLLTAVSPVAGPHTSLSHGPWVGNFFLLGKSLIVIPRGLRGLGPKGGIGVLGYPSLHMTHPLH